MKHTKIFIVLIICSLICIDCGKISKNQQLDFASKTFPELIKLGYELRGNDRIFSEICRILNDSILIKRNSFYMSPYYEIIHKDTLISLDLRFNILNDFPRGSDRMYFNVKIDDGNIFVNNEINNISNIYELAKNYIFCSDSTEWIYTKRKYNIKYFGETDISVITAFLEIIQKRKDSLPINDWNTFFECMHELIKVFENRRNEISLWKWGECFDNLSEEKKQAVIEVVWTRIYLYFNLKN